MDRALREAIKPIIEEMGGRYSERAIAGRVIEAMGSVLFIFIEPAAEAAHAAWMAEKRRRGVTSWPNEQGIEQMVPWAELDESIREFDRIVVRAMLAAWGLEP